MGTTSRHVWKFRKDQFTGVEQKTVVKNMKENISANF